MAPELRVESSEAAQAARLSAVKSARSPDGLRRAATASVVGCVSQGLQGKYAEGVTDQSLGSAAQRRHPRETTNKHKRHV